MSSLNKAMLIGHLGRDPEVRYLNNGDAVATMTLATSDQWKDKQTGEKKEATEWHRVTMFRKLAEVAGQYLKKGSLVYVEGKITTRKWTDKDGVERYTTEINADTMQMLGGRPSQADGEKPKQSQQDGQRQMSDMDDDIPFANPYRGRIGLSI